MNLILRLAKDIKTELFDASLMKIESFIKKIPIEGKYQKFIFININSLSQEKKDFLEQHKLEKKEFKHITKYKIKRCAEEIVVIKLTQNELYKLTDVICCELFEYKPICRNSVMLTMEFLRAIYPQRGRWRKYVEILLDFYIRNYQNCKDNEIPILQSFLEGYKYIIDHIKGNSILDIGSYAGFLPILAKLERPELEVTASDINYEFLDFARDYCDKHNLEINFIKLDILNPKIQKKFDTTFSCHLLEHFKKKENMRVIRNHISFANKRTVLVMPFEEFISVKDHKQMLNKENLEKVVNTLELPYKIEKISGWNHALIVDLDQKNERK